LIAVIDSSVAVKWYASEPGSERATSLLAHQIGAPDLILAEVGNAVWKKVRRGQMSAEQAAEALPHLIASVTILPAEPLAERALMVGLELGHPVYDCFFLLLAEELNLPLITADQRLEQRGNELWGRGRVSLLEDWEAA
jgi:predicted nucleic acid-binding protein